jgi:hypothetical protein
MLALLPPAALSADSEGLISARVKQLAKKGLTLDEVRKQADFKDIR